MTLFILFYDLNGPRGDYNYQIAGVYASEEEAEMAKFDFLDNETFLTRIKGRYSYLPIAAFFQIQEVRVGEAADWMKGYLI